MSKEVEGRIAQLENENKELRKCARKALIFFDDVMPQVGKLCIQDYANLNEAAILLRKFGAAS
jgi:hypothetical protein